MLESRFSRPPLNFTKSTPREIPRGKGETTRIVDVILKYRVQLSKDCKNGKLIDLCGLLIRDNVKKGKWFCTLNHPCLFVLLGVYYVVSLDSNLGSHR